jgi:GTP cyclohydrolase I
MKPSRDAALLAVRTLLAYAGENPDRPGLQETPDRVVKAIEQDWAAGYNQDPAEVLKVFEDGGEDYTGILFQGSIPATTNCEHHMCAVIGVAHFAYIPDGRIVGLSKIPRLIGVFAQRYQVQERLTRQIVDSFMEHVQPLGCGLVMQLRHLCMEGRGVRLPNTVTTTSDMRGIFIEKPHVKEEFMNLVRMEGLAR